MTTWVLMAWLCASPGPTGECRPQPEQVFATRAACQRAGRELRASSVHIWARCQRRSTWREGAEAPV